MSFPKGPTAPRNGSSIYLAMMALCVLCGTHVVNAQHQTETTSPIVVRGGLPYYVQLRVYDQDAAWLPTLHSFSQAQHEGKWLLMAGRTNGLHDLTRGGINAFPPSAQNIDVWVIDPATRESWRRSLTDPTAQLGQYQVDSLSTTNSQFYQTGERLIMTGGYGFSAGSGFQTFDTLTSVDIPELMQWVQTGAGQAADSIRQLRDPLFRVTGGAMYAIDGTTHLVFGQDFSGGYHPFREGEYTQQIRSFQILDDANGLRIAGASATAPDPNYRRRDLDVVPILRPTDDAASVQPGLIAFSGVFTPANGAWTVPVEIDAMGQPAMADPTAASTFKQGMNGYHSAKLSMYSEATGQMHNVLFGGISLQYYDRQTERIVSDNELPFINQLTSIVSNADGEFAQHLLSEEFPVMIDAITGAQLLFGANAEFLVSADVPRYANDVIQLDQLTSPTRLGYIFGGLVADAPNRGNTAASNIIFEVLLTPRIAGDFTHDGQLDARDLDVLTAAIHSAPLDETFDLNLDHVVDKEDHRVWVQELKNTYFGDANLDTEFNSSDLIHVFQAGEYEDDVAANSTWTTGDWNADMDFDSGDLVTAFQDGGYEAGPTTQRVTPVPEPQTAVMLWGVTVIALVQRCTRNQSSRR